MRQKKIRGHKRLQKRIEHWRQSSLILDVNNLFVRQRDYVKIYVHPWSGISIVNSSTPSPRGKTKQSILNALLDVYDNWKTQLDKLEQPYYLKLWLFEPRFSNSQVVCAIGDNINYYNQTFYKPDYTLLLNQKKYGKLSSRISKLNWDFYLDEDAYDNSDVGEKESYASVKDFEETKVWFDALLRQPHRTEKLNEKIGDVEEIYFFKRGSVWIGAQA